MTDVKKSTSLLRMAKDKTGEVNRREEVSIHPSMLVVEDGFNVRGVGLNQDEYWTQEHIVAHVDGFANAYYNGDYVPPLVVSFDQDSQKAIVRDGHHRLRGLLKAIEKGADIQRVPVVEFKGDEANQALLMLNSANGLALTAVEKAEIYNRFKTWGYSVSAIAKKAAVSKDSVYQMLKVYELPLAKKQAIQRGELSVIKAITPVVKAEAKVRTKSATAQLMSVIRDVTSAKVHDDVVTITITRELWDNLQEGKR